MKNFICTAIAFLFCVMLSGCGAKDEVMVEVSENNDYSIGLIGSYIELVKKSYPINFNKETKETSVTVRVSAINHLNCQVNAVKADLLNGENEVITTLEANPSEIQNILEKGKKNIEITFSSYDNEIDFEKLKEEAKYIILSEISGVVTYKMVGTIAGKHVEASFKIDEDKIKGGYHYGIGTSQDIIALEGSYVANDKTVVIREFYDGQVTGRWELVLVPDARATLKGTMTNYRGNKYVVELVEDSSLHEISVPDTESVIKNNNDLGCDKTNYETINSSSGSSEIDEFLDEYEECIKSAKRLKQKIQSGDKSALSEYNDYMLRVQKLTPKSAKIKGTMSLEQAQRFQRIVASLADIQ